MTKPKFEQISDLIFTNPETGKQGAIVSDLRVLPGTNSMSFDVRDEDGEQWTVAIAIGYMGKTQNA